MAKIYNALLHNCIEPKIEKLFDDSASGKYTPPPAETLLHSLEQAAAGIGLYVNADKTEYMCFNQRCDISTLNGSSLKLVDKFTYLGSSVSSTETDMNMQLAKAWTAIDKLSDLTNKIKQIFPISSRVDTAVWMHYMETN